MSCPTYEPPFGSQLLQGGITGPYDCTAWAASRAIAFATCGSKVPTGRTVRLLSNEPKPNPKSPGLNLPQVAAVAREDFGVYLEVRIGSQRVSFAEYEARRMGGQGAVIQLDYSPIAASGYDAGRGFTGGHALFESHSTTIDSLADGRAAGVWKYTGSVYPRDLIRRAAGLLDIGGGQTVPDGYVWAAFTRDVVPAYRATVPKGTILLYEVTGGRIVRRVSERTGGFSANASAPRSYPDAAGLPGTSYYLSRLLTGSRAGWYISGRYVREVP